MGFGLADFFTDTISATVSHEQRSWHSYQSIKQSRTGVVRTPLKIVPDITYEEVAFRRKKKTSVVPFAALVLVIRFLTSGRQTHVPTLPTLTCEFAAERR